MATIATARTPLQTLSTSGGNVRIEPKGSYVVSDAVLQFNNRKCNVAVGRITFTPQNAIESKDCTTAIQTGSNSAVTTLKFRDGRTVKLRTTLVGNRPIMQVDLPSVAGELVIELTGADRLSFATTDGFTAHTLGRDNRGTLLPSAGAFQNRNSQDGIVVHAASSTSTPMHMVHRNKKTSIHLASKPGANISVILTGFCGDASIACEDVAPGVKLAVVREKPANPAIGAVDVARSTDTSPRVKGTTAAPEKFLDTGWMLFTNGDRALAPLLADQREAQIRAGWMIGRDADKFLDLAFGGDLGIIRRDFSEDESMTLTLRGLITARFQTDAESFPLLNTDYYGGVAFAHRFGKNAWEVFFYHQSAHLGDETLDFGTRARIDYGREAIRFLWSHYLTDDLRIYGGPTLNVAGSEGFVQGKIMLQAGGEYRFSACNIPMYAAADLQVREQNNWRPSLNTQVGMYLGKSNEKNPKPKTRVFLEVFTGYSNMGQYWNTYETSAMFGIGYNW
ncbi:MAG: DUF1207 domain-containing protein [bacterium]|nr:DUF1207 domain-containing protein [bacterium]